MTKNVFLDLIHIKFPWYKQMDKLIGGSPVVNWLALANSQMPLDLFLLEAKKPTVGVSIIFLVFALKACSKG